MTILTRLGLITLAASAAWGQTTSASISGTVLDPSGAAVANATVSLTDQNRQTTVKTQSEPSGRYVFTVVQPGTYTITVEAPGFRTSRRENVTVQANDRLAITDTTLQVGNVAETVEVSAQAVSLQTESGERSDVLVTKQLENIAVNGRSYLALAALTPGVVSTGNFTTAGTGGLANISANGARSNQNQLTLNGIGNVDTGNNGDQLATISLDSVQEYRILTGSYQAEYGRSSGAQISVVTKSGSSQLHGSAYYYRRHDSLNANDWLSNRDGRSKKLYRYYNPGYTIGGPVYIPGIGFNKNRDKLFFFWSQEYQDQLQPEAVRRVTVPTALERQGDFSQSVDRFGNKVYVRDPNLNLPCSATDTRGCFPNNVIPASRQYKPGMSLLNFFPAPTVDKNITRDYNLESQISTGKPRREDLIRVDYNPTSKWRVFTHFINNKNSTTTPYGSFVLGSNLPNIPITDARPGKSFAAGVTTLLSPVMTNEFTFGYGKNSILIQPTAGPSVLSRQTTGIDLPVLYPGAVQDNYIPNFGYGGTKIANSNSYGTNRSPFTNFNNTIDAIDNFSRVQGAHVMKFGIYIQKSRKDQSPDGDPNGFYEFGDTPIVNGNYQNPFDTGYGFSNAALGVYQTFRQNNKFAIGQYRYWNIEWYAQDTWKITRRLTLDYGMRMAWIQPQYDQSGQTASFLRERWDPGQAPRLYYPDPVTGGAIDRATGQTQPVFAVGRIVPNSGNLLNGVVQGKDIGNAAIVRDRGIHWGPRLGIAWDVTGEQKLVVRTGGGIYFDRYQGNQIFRLLNNPPTAVPASLTYGFAQQIDPATALVGPPALNALDYNGQNPTVYSYNFGVQSRLPQSFVLDVAYVGSQSRHLQNAVNLNAIPYGAFFRPENAGLNDANFYRPFRGFGNINVYKADANANYNSLQVSVNRRFSRNIFFDLAYTWSKALTTASGDGDFARIDNNNRQAYYALADFHRKHNLAVNWVYELPSVFKSGIGKAALGGWQLSGIYQYQSGQPDTIGFSIPGVANQNLTGSFTEGARVWLVGDPTKGVNGGPYFNINPAAFLPPQVGSIGLEAPNRYFIKPGINNWNLSLQKAFSFKEKASLQFRADAFNVLNHTQFSDYNRTINFSGLGANATVTNLPRFDAATNRWINPTGFGAVNTVRDPRTMQLMMRLQF